MSRSSRVRDVDYNRDDRRSRATSEMSSLASRVFIGNVKNFSHRDIQDWMSKYGKVLGKTEFSYFI